MVHLLYTRTKYVVLVYLFLGVLVVSETPLHARPVAQEQTPASATGITLEAKPAYGGTYRIESWLPVQVTVQNDGADIAAEVRISVSGGGTFAAQLDLPSGARKSVTLYAYIPEFLRRLPVRLVQTTPDIPQPLLAEQTLDLEPHTTNTQMVAVVTNEGVDLPLPNRLQNNRRVARIPTPLTTLPEHVLGLSPLDTVILSDVSTDNLTANQRFALHAWVARGGQLLISGGLGAQQTLAGLPQSLWPIVVQGTQQADTTMLVGPMGAVAETLTVSQGEPIEAFPKPYVLRNSALNAASLSGADWEIPVLIERPVGNGFVTFCAAPLNTPALVGWEGEQRFWSELLHRQILLPPGFGPEDMSLHTITEGNFASALTRLPTLELPSLLLLGILLITYILCVGPITYLLLRKLDRQALGWIIVPGLTILFSLGAYSLGYQQRGGDIIVNQITLVEPLTPNVPSASTAAASNTSAPDSAVSLARVRSFIGLFSPIQQEYILEVAPSTLTSGARTDAVAAKPTLLRPISLVGPWDRSMIDLEGTFVQGASTQHAAGAQVLDFDIPQWSMRGFMGEEVLVYQGIQAEVTLDTKTLSVDVVNQGNQALYDVVLVQGAYIARLGDITVGARATGEIVFDEESKTAQRPQFGMNEPLSYSIYGDELDAMNKGGGVSLSPDLQQRVALLDAISNYGSSPRNAQPLLVAWADSSPLNVNIPDQFVIHQHLSLITFAPPLRVAAETIELSADWLHSNFDMSQLDDMAFVCTNEFGNGISRLGQPVEETLQIPQGLVHLHTIELLLRLVADDHWPELTTIELFDWTAHEWVVQNIDIPARQRIVRHTVNEPKRFVSSSGEIRARFASDEFREGCFSVDASITLSRTE